MMTNQVTYGLMAFIVLAVVGCSNQEGLDRAIEKIAFTMPVQKAHNNIKWQQKGAFFWILK